MPKTKPIQEIVQDELTRFFLGYLKPEFKAVRKELRQGQKQLLQNQKDLKTYANKRFDEATADRQDMIRQLSDLKMDTPTRQEFNDLKSRVNRYHPVH